MSKTQIPVNESAYDSPFVEPGDSYRSYLGGEQRPDFEILAAGCLGRGIKWEHEHVFSLFGRLYYARHSRNRIQYGQRELRLTPDALLFIPETVHFHCRSDGSSEHLWLHFRSSRRRYVLNPEPRRLPLTPAVKRLAEACYKAFAPDTPLEVRYHLNQALLIQVAAMIPAQAKVSPPPAVIKAMDYIRHHLGEELSVKTLGRACGYSSEHLSSLFVQHLKQPPGSYIRSERVREAARHLAHTDDTIDAIAQELGFANRHHFSRVFARIMQEPPAGFRRRVRG